MTDSGLSTVASYKNWETEETSGAKPPPVLPTFAKSVITEAAALKRLSGTVTDGNGKLRPRERDPMHLM